MHPLSTTPPTADLTPAAAAPPAVFPAFHFAAAAPLRYAVHFTRGVFAPENPLLEQVLAAGPEPAPQRFICALDAGLVAAQPDLATRIEAYAAAHAGTLDLVFPPLVLPGGEAAKNSFDVPHQLLRLARRLRLPRQSHLVAVGGGAFLDAAGFAAALVHRGMRLIRIPSTVLAQNDSGVGVKNGLNLGGVKNFLGTFAPPAAVLNDFDLLRTLPERHWCAGMAEAFNVPVVNHLYPEISVHLVAAIPHGLTVEYMPWSSGLYEEVPQPVDGMLTVPDKPGLGLKFDQAALKKYGV